MTQITFPLDPECISIKAESAFYASLLECPESVFVESKGIQKRKIDNSTYLIISKNILSSPLFYSYLSLEGSNKIFGTRNPIYDTSTLTYKEGVPIRINHFNTRLLLAFIEVQLGIGFTGSLFQVHKKQLENIIQGKSSKLQTNYYHPFKHEDNVGIHYILDPKGGHGYSNQNWDNYAKYFESSIEAAFKTSSEDFGFTHEGLIKQISEFKSLVITPYKESFKVNMPPIRRFGQLIYDTLFFKGSEDSCFIPNPIKNTKMMYIHLVDCILDMPYKNGAVVIFSSTCVD